MNLLLVSPRFPPTSAADSQRLRQLLPYFTGLGCHAEVLAIDPACCNESLDSWQSETLPLSVPIHRARGLSRRWSRLPGLGSLEARCYPALSRMADRVLRTKNFDAVYFSTTAFGFFRLGPIWRRRYGVPFFIDYQDPWVNDYYRLHPSIVPPGGRLKYFVVDQLHRFREPRVLRYASGYTTVSAAYCSQLQSRYPFALNIPSRVLPFPGSSRDFQSLASHPASELPFDPCDGLIHWVSIGRGGADLHPALCGLFDAIARYAPPELLNRLRIHFLGTSYAPSGRGVPSIAPLASRFGLDSVVVERTDRFPLSHALAILKAAHSLLVIGSSDPSYTASKIYPYLLARRPLLAIMHQESSVCSLLQACGGGRLAAFTGSTSTISLASTIERIWLRDSQHSVVTPLDSQSFHPYTAEVQAASLVDFIRGCIALPA